LRTSRGGSAARGAADGLADPFIGSAAAQISVHGLRDLVIARIGRFGEKSGGGHDLSRLAIATLWNFFGDPSLLQNMWAIRSQAFNGSDIFAGNLRDGRGAGANGSAFDVNRASAAESGTASELGSGKLQRIAEHPEQRGFGREVQFFIVAVNAECDVGHKFWLRSGQSSYPTARKSGMGRSFVVGDGKSI
jgi:hypothetical protein